MLGTCCELQVKGCSFFMTSDLWVLMLDYSESLFE